ncbi:MAG: hypothetical protein LBK00_09100 [Treponema sp.]|jgi:hypothetical protein|nr:hypothetical protein [Treponema sp.]
MPESNEDTLTKRIPAAVIDAAETALTALIAPLEPYLRPLTLDDRKRMAKMGPKTQSFVEHAEAYAKVNPEFRPGHFDMAAFTGHLETTHELWNLIDKVEQFAVTLKDTLSAEGSDALEAAYVYYNALKLAARENVAGAKAQLEDLSSRLPSRSRKGGGEGSEAGESAGS